MTDTPVITEPVIESPQTTILQRIAPPFFSFSFVLFCSLVASQAFLLPRLTTFRVGEVDVSVDEAQAYERTLRAEVISLEDQRKRFVLPHIDDVHDDLMRLKRRTPSVVDVRARVDAAMRGVAEPEGATVRIDAVNLDAATRTVTVRGAVEDPKPSSMAVLGAAVDAVRGLEGVLDLAPPALTREEIPGGYRSPFTFSFRLEP